MTAAASGRLLLLPAIVMIAAGCGEPSAPAGATTAQPTPPPSSPVPNIEGFKFVRLGMTLEELTRLSADDFVGERDLLCVPEPQAMRCLADDLTIADAPAVVDLLFLAEGPVRSYEKAQIPPSHEPTQQEIRMGVAAAKRSAGESARGRARGENRNRELRSLAPFRLAEIYITAERGAALGVRGALQDRYGTPKEFPTSGFKVWQSPTARIVLDESRTATRVTYSFKALQSARDA